MPNIIRLKITRHANDKMLDLGITKDQIKIAITKGSKFRQADGYLIIFGYIAVACKKIGSNTYKIKTVYLR